MPSVYLSPSTEDYELFVTGGNEEYYMNQIADAMIPYLKASGIDYDRNDPGATPRQIIEKSNSKFHNLHFKLDMATGIGNLAGKARGETVIYYAGSPNGKVAADILAGNLKKIYPYPELVTISSDRLDPELRDTDALALTVMLGYRDNLEDAAWVANHIDAVAKNLSMSLAEILKVPFVDKAPAAKNWRY